jgi:EAL domain-containing protein (putative c-di-GMP-specific phosphodiesterase class I)
MLKELGANIIIEGVETEAQKDFLIECGCKKAQGFLFYKPMPVEEFKKLILKSDS